MIENIKIGVQVSSDGTLPKVEKEASNVNEQLAKAAVSSDKLNNSLRASNSLKVAAAKKQPEMTGQEYGKARSLTGASGASARDFADQSRGLGGLVRLYATYAANLFAVSAAFSALKTAMDTSNMVRGMDQLGAISGVAIGTLSKNLVAATDGALSLREAAQATTKIISSGIDSSAIEKIGKVAKGASQALGIDMPDAVSRLTRGITKLEPELLDELGIFVKIDDVVSKYATTVGKSASALTDFERRQAFANAVLEQGQKKFGDIKLETNPYDKLLASVKDLGQTILEVVNKALVPFLNVLSSNPTALFAVVASLATMLVKQAIPAIGQFRQGLQDAEVSAASFAKQKAEDAVNARGKQMKAIEQMIEQEADLQIEKTDAAAKKVAEIQAKSQQKAGSAAMGLLDAPAQERTKEMYAAAQAQAAAIDQQVKSIDKRTKAGKAQVAILLEEKDAITQAVQVSKASQAAEEALEAKKKIHREELEKDPKRFGAVGVAQANAAQAEATANRTRIISNAGVTGSLVGVRAAYTELKAEFAAQGKTMWSAPFTAIGAGAAAVTGRLSALLGSLGPYMMALQIAVAVGTVLNGVFSKNSEQADKFNKSLDSLSKAVQTAGDNAAYFIKQDWDAALPLAVVTSRATALKELSTAITNVAKDFDLVASKRGMWDGFWNGVFAITPFAKSDKQAAAKKLSEGIEESISLVPYGPLRKEYEEKIKKVLNISGGMTAQNIEFKFKTMGEKEAIAAGKAVALVSEEVANKQKAGAQAAADVDTAFKDTTNAYQELARSLSNSTPLETFANKLLSISVTLTDSLKSPEEAFASLTKLLSEPKKMAILGPESFAALQASKAEIVDISKEIKKLEAEAEALDKRKKTEIPERVIAGSGYDIAKQKIDAQIKEADDKILKLRTTGAEIASKIYNSVNIEAFKTASKIFSAEMNAANAQAGLTIRKAYSSLFTGQAAINEQASVAKEDLAIKRNLILITADLIKSNFLLINSNKEKLVEDKKSAAQKTLETEAGRPGAAAEKARSEATAYLESGYSSEMRPILAERRVLTAKQPGQQIQAEYTAMEAGQRQALQPFLDAMKSTQAQLIALGAADKSIDIDKELKTKQESVRLSIIQKNYEVQVNELALKRRDILDQLVGKTTEQTVKERISLENALEANKQKAKEMDLEGRIATSQSVMAKSDFNKQPDKFKEGVKTQLAQDQTSLADIKAASEREKSLKAEADQLRVIDAIYKQRLESIDKAAQASKDDADKKQSDTAIAKTAREQELSNLVALDAVTERTRITRQYDIDLLSIKNDKEQKTTELQIEQDKQLGEIAAKKAFINSFTIAEVATEQAKIDALTKQANLVYKAIDDAKASNMTEEEFLNFRTEKGKEALDILRQQVAIDNGIVKLKTDQASGLAYQNQEETRVNKSYATRQNIIDAVALAQDKQITKAAALAIIIDQQNQKLADQNAYLNSAKNLSENLNSTFALFGESMTKAGEGLAGLVEGFAQAAVEAEKYGEARSKAQEKVDNSVNMKDYFQAKKELDKLDSDNARNEMKRDIQVVGNAKKLFAEKTVAYKILGGIEKAMHLARLAMDIKEMFFDTTKTGTSIGNSLLRAGAAGVEAVVKAYTLPPPLGFVTGAAMTGIIAGILGSAFKGGGRASASFAMNSEQRQETQGTGTTYDSLGNKTETGGGVFGDSSAKVDNINQSLEIIKENSVDGLTYDNKMLKALQGLSDALTGAATAIYAIPGLRQGGTGFGSQTGTTSDAGFLGSIPLIGGILGSIFGGGTTSTSSIESAGIELKGTFQQLIDDTSGSVKQYKDVLTQFHEDGGWFGSDDDWTERRREWDAVGSGVSSAIRDVFLESKNLFTDIGAQAGVTAATVQSVFNTMKTDIDIDLKGLTGDQITAELNAVIGSRLDEAAKSLFSSFDKYKKFGESYLTTVVRVVDTNTKIQQVLTNMGIDTIVNGVYDVTEALAKAAGGIDKFISQYDFFKSNFLTEAEQLTPVQKAVTTEMSRLGYASINTRDEFKVLVQGLDLTTKAGQENYQALMNVQEGFIAVTAAAVKEAEERKTLDKKLTQTNASKQKLREMELEGLFAGNRELQKEIWLKEDQVAATKALQTSLQNTTKTIKSQITSLTDYKLALQSGANSTLTATQQYTLAKTEVDALTATISKSANTPEEVEARSAAIGKLSSATDKWLTLSRGLYASGSQYTVDFNNVMGIITAVGGSLQTQLTDAEKQLTALETSNTYLETISSSTKTTAELLQTYLGLGGTPITAQGFAIGTNYVPNDMMAQIHKGERIIPAADNFVLMSRLTTTDNYTRDMCQQIRELNQKISSLEQTVADGAVMNAQATDRNTQQVTQAVTDGSDKTIQSGRLQNRAIIK